MNESELIRLRHMLDAAEEALAIGRHTDDRRRAGNA